MLGKGAKRKLDEDEDGLEGEALAGLLPQATPGCPAADGPSKASYTLQRQTIFNISLMKLYSQRAPAEPSLARRVLISNMLRRIQDELRREGGPRPLFFPPASPPPDDPVDEGFREAQPAFGVPVPPPTPLPQAPPPPPPGPGPAPPDSCLTPASLLEDDDALFSTSPSPDQPHPHPVPVPPQGALPRPPHPAAKDSFSSALEEIEELCTTVTATMTTTSYPPGVSLHPLLPPLLLPLAGSDSKERTAKKPAGTAAAPLDGRVAMATGELRPTDSAPPAPSLPPPPSSGGLDAGAIAPSSSASSSSSAFLTDLALDDILFADIDTSMYDFDACTSATGAGPAKTAPAVTADDLVKTLSPYGQGPAAPVPSGQPFKMDLAELDHIMEVLVGS